MKALAGLIGLVLLAWSVIHFGELVAKHYADKARESKQEQERILAIQVRKCQAMWPELGSHYDLCIGGIGDAR